METLKTYTPSKNHPLELKTIASGFFITIALFTAFPLLHKATQATQVCAPEKPSIVTDPPPLNIELPKPPKPLKDKEFDPPELIKEQQEVFIEPIPAWLTPGSNGIQIGSRMDGIEKSIDAENDYYLQSQLEKQPKALVAISPIPPYAMKNISGKVVVQFIIQANGRVRNITIASSTHREFNDSAIQAVNKSKWSPGEVKGKAVDTLVKLPIYFR